MKNVAIIAPSGCVDDFDEKKISSFFIHHDLNVFIYPSCYKKYRYMAGDDNERLKDIHDAFLNKTIDTIIALRGGYGAIRLLDKIDYELIKENKKNFVGFSDITLLLVSFYKRANLVSFHGKMAINGVINMNDKEFLNYKNSIENKIFNSNLKGGILWGGNLASIISLFGSDPDTYIPDEDIILFLEDINEPDYKIDRMFNQILRNIPLREKIKGVIFGEFIGAGRYLEDIKEEFINSLCVPYENKSDIGHGESNIVVPFGIKI